MDSRLARWLALSIFAILIAGWFAAALHLTGASAGRPGFPFNLRSNLAADYGADQARGRIASLRISVIADFLRDLGFGGDAPDLLAGLDSPVPTATARNFEGDPPYTATVVPSSTPTDTEVPTSTSTPKPASTKTPKPTRTHKPESTEVPADTVAPTISGGTLFPSPGTLLPSCDGNDIAISGLRVVDPGPSSGISWVRLKYLIVGPESKGYQFSSDIGPPLSGGWTDGPGSTWDGYYNGDITINFSDGYAFWTTGGKLFARPLRTEPTATPTLEPTATPTPEPTPTPTPEPTPTPTPEVFEVKVWSIVEDDAGNQGYELHGTYTLAGSCGG